jgi:hypothetical protein
MLATDTAPAQKSRPTSCSGMILSGIVFGVEEVVVAPDWRDGIEDLSDCSGDSLDRALGSSAELMFEFGEALLDRI